MALLVLLVLAVSIQAAIYHRDFNFKRMVRQVKKGQHGTKIAREASGQLAYFGIDAQVTFGDVILVGDQTDHADGRSRFILLTREMLNDQGQNRVAVRFVTDSGQVYIRELLDTRVVCPEIVDGHDPSQIFVGILDSYIPITPVTIADSNYDFLGEQSFSFEHGRYGTHDVGTDTERVRLFEASMMSRLQSKMFPFEFDAQGRFVSRSDMALDTAVKFLSFEDKQYYEIAFDGVMFSLDANDDTQKTISMRNYAGSISLFPVLPERIVSSTIITEAYLPDNQGYDTFPGDAAEGKYFGIPGTGAGGSGAFNMAGELVAIFISIVYASQSGIMFIIRERVNTVEFIVHMEEQMHELASNALSASGEESFEGGVRDDPVAVSDSSDDDVALILVLMTIAACVAVGFIDIYWRNQRHRRRPQNIGRDHLKKLKQKQKKTGKKTTLSTSGVS